jgi:S1-C subfamily serine protease
VKIEVGPLESRRSVTVTLAKYNVPGKVLASNRPPARAGLRVDYGSIVAQGTPPRRIPPGVVIREVIPNSAADQAHLQVGDAITHVNRRPVATPDDYYKEMERAAGAARTVEITYLTAENRTETISLSLK